MVMSCSCNTEVAKNCGKCGVQRKKASLTLALVTSKFQLKTPVDFSLIISWFHVWIILLLADAMPLPRDCILGVGEQSIFLFLPLVFILNMFPFATVLVLLIISTAVQAGTCPYSWSKCPDNNGKNYCGPNKVCYNCNGCAQMGHTCPECPTTNPPAAKCSNKNVGECAAGKYCKVNSYSSSCTSCGYGKFSSCASAATDCTSCSRSSGVNSAKTSCSGSPTDSDGCGDDTGDTGGGTGGDSHQGNGSPGFPEGPCTGSYKCDSNKCEQGRYSNSGSCQNCNSITGNSKGAQGLSGSTLGGGCVVCAAGRYSGTSLNDKCSVTRFNAGLCCVSFLRPPLP